MPQKLDKPQRGCTRTRNQDQEESQTLPLPLPLPLSPLEVGYRSQSDCQDLTSVLWLLLYRFSFADTLLCGWMSRPSPGARVPVLTAPSDTCRMRAASHEIFARAQTLAAKDTCCDTAVVGSYRKYMYCSSISPYIHTYCIGSTSSEDGMATSPVGARSFELGGGVRWRVVLLLLLVCGCFSVRGPPAPRPFNSSRTVATGPRSAG